MDALELNFNDYKTVGETARILGVSTQTVRKWVDNGKIEAVIHPFNGYRLINKKDIESILWKIQKTKK